MKTLKRWILLLVLVAAALGIWNLIDFAGSHLAQFPDTKAGRKLAVYAMANGYSSWDYPKSLMELLERNPETFTFVSEYPEAKDRSYEIDLSSCHNQETVPLFLQWDQRWGYLPYGKDIAAITGCGPVCLSMVAFHLTGDDSFSPDKMLRFASDNGYYVDGSGSSWTLISEGGKKLGFDVNELPLDEDRIRKTLEQGIPIIFVVGPGDFTTSGHFLVMTGWENGKIRLNDPNSLANSQRLWSYETIKDQIRNLWAVQIPQ
jgi:hypothetical protein